jgi:hypothetical protein
MPGSLAPAIKARSAPDQPLTPKPRAAPAIFDDIPICHLSTIVVQVSLETAAACCKNQDF